MEKDFCVEFVDQCGGVFITHPSIKSAKQHLAELPQIPNARQNLKQLGVEVLKIVVKLDSSVGVCVGQIKLDSKLAITLDETWREWCVGSDGGCGSVFMDYHALPCKARNDNARGLKTLKDSKNCGRALQALKNLGKVSDLGGRAFHKFFNLAKLPTQS